MANVDEPKHGDMASELPSKHLPAVPYADLPEPLPLKKIVGASVILLASAIGSGEYVLWPYITSQVGLVAMWAAIVGILTQYFLNMEITRYTLATGETAVTGFTRLWKPWGILFVLMTLIPWVWPGWSTGAATVLTFVAGGGNVVLISILGLIAIGIALTASPVVYQVVEKVQMVLIALIVVFVLLALFFGTTGEAWGAFFTGFANFGQFPDEIGIATMLGALAFAGAGGALNLTQSNWIRDKGLGMGARIPRIVSPLTGEEEAKPSLGYFFPQDEKNLARWREWWRVANLEQFFTFFVIGGVTIIVFSVLTYSTVPVGSVDEKSLDFILVEGQTLMQTIAPWFGIAFWVTGVIVLFSTELAVLDMVGRVTADVFKINYLRDSTFWSESKIYFTIIWLEIIVGALILLAGIQQPVVLLIIASALNGIVMFVYSALLIWLNRGVLPKAIRVGGIRLIALIWSTLFFGYFSVLLIIDMF